MTAALGTAMRPVRVAVVGAGPAGFFVAEALLRRDAPRFAVDVFDRLPTPFGLVRAGVAPDHQQIKKVRHIFERTAAHERFRFLGNVSVGRDVSVAELAQHYDQLVFAIGSAADRPLRIPGEDLATSYAGTSFVGWYNAHPDFVPGGYDLSHERAVVVGAGNVALDIARVLLRDVDELAATDIAAHALAALRDSRVREVVLLARRGPAQAAFDLRELRDIAALRGVTVALDEAQLQATAAEPHLTPAERKLVEGMLAIARLAPATAPHRLRVEFLASPVALLPDERRRVRAVVIEENELVAAPDGGPPQAHGTGRTRVLEAGVVFRAIGYRGRPVKGLPFDERTGVLPNEGGRLIADGAILPGHYATGWCRRGPSGVIGTNRPDADTVAEHMVADVAQLRPAADERRAPGAIDALLASRGVRVTSYEDWKAIDAVELELGRAHGKVREKLTTVGEMLHVLGEVS